MHHVHRYRAVCRWQGSTGAGYDSYDRAHLVDCPPAASALRVSSDPAFRGDPALLNPEQLLVAAASSCQLLSFLAVAARARIDVIGYSDDAEGDMPDGDRYPWVTAIRLRPVITVAAPAEEVSDERIAQLCQVAHRECFIANSLRSEVTVDPAVLRSTPSSDTPSPGGPR